MATLLLSPYFLSVTVFPFGGSSPSGSSCTAPSREYLSQETINDGALYNLINLNARVFDPVLVRFMGADPVINPYVPQDLNPYSYGLNSPLWLPDPSGMCSWFIDCIFEGIGNAVASVYNATIGAMMHSGNVFLRHNPLLAQTIGAVNEIGAGVLCGPCAGVVSAADTAMQGGKTGQIFEAAAISLGEWGAFHVTGDFLQGAGLQENTAAVFVAHGAVGGLASVAQGGNFASGFLAAGVGSLGDSIDAGNLYVNVAIHAVAGGFGSVLGGGKFENGAITGAFGYLFNRVAHTGGLNGYGYTPDSGDNSLLAREIFAEAASSPEAYVAIGWTVVDRVGAPGFPDSLVGVVYQVDGKGDYQLAVGSSLWNQAEDPMNLTGPNARAYDQALGVANGILAGQISNPTNGATFFYSGPTPRGFFQDRLSTGRLVPTITSGPFTFLRDVGPR